MAYQGSFLLGISWLQPVFDAMNAVKQSSAYCICDIIYHIPFDSNRSEIIGGPR